MFYQFEFDQKHVSTEHQVTSFSVNTIRKAAMFFHSHKCTAITVPVNRKGKIITERNSYAIENDTVYITPPNISHTEIPLNENVSFEYYCLQIRDIVDPVSATDEIIPVKLSRDQFSDVITHLNLAAKFFQLADQNENVAMLNIVCFYQLFIDLLKQKGLTLQTEQQNRFVPSYIIEIQKFISQNCHLDIRVNELAQQHGISKSTLEKNFKKFIGKTPKEYLQTVRLSTASRLLKESNYSVSQIFSMTGYTSASYFIRTFKKRFSMTPTAYRDSLKDE